MRSDAEIRSKMPGLPRRAPEAPEEADYFVVLAGCIQSNRLNLITYRTTRSNRFGPLYRNHFIFGEPRISHVMSVLVCLPTYFCSPFRSCNSRLKLPLGAILSPMPVFGWWGAR